MAVSVKTLTRPPDARVALAMIGVALVRRRPSGWVA
jgi:hypothetical protein